MFQEEEHNSSRVDVIEIQITQLTWNSANESSNTNENINTQETNRTCDPINQESIAEECSDAGRIKKCV